MSEHLSPFPTHIDSFDNFNIDHHSSISFVEPSSFQQNPSSYDQILEYLTNTYLKNSNGTLVDLNKMGDMEVNSPFSVLKNSSQVVTFYGSPIWDSGVLITANDQYDTKNHKIGTDGHVDSIVITDYNKDIQYVIDDKNNNGVERITKFNKSFNDGMQLTSSADNKLFDHFAYDIQGPVMTKIIGSFEDTNGDGNCENGVVTDIKSIWGHTISDVTTPYTFNTGMFNIVNYMDSDYSAQKIYEETK